MKIVISRHAKNNMRLYKIDIKEIKETIKSPDTQDTNIDKDIYIKYFRDKFNELPLKVITTSENDNMIIISVYPLKKKFRGGLKNEG